MRRETKPPSSVTSLGTASQLAITKGTNEPLCVLRFGRTKRPPLPTNVRSGMPRSSPDWLREMRTSVIAIYQTEPNGWTECEYRCVAPRCASCAGSGEFEGNVGSRQRGRAEGGLQGLSSEDEADRSTSVLHVIDFAAHVDPPMHGSERRLESFVRSTFVTLRA